MSNTSTFGFTVLKNGLYFDVFNKQGLSESIKVLGKNYAIIGVKDATNGIIPIEFDGIGGFFDGSIFYKDYVIVIATKEPIYYHRTVLKAIGWLYSQLSILIVEDSQPSIVESVNIPNLNGIQEGVKVLGERTTKLLHHIRKGWETDYKEQGISREDITTNT